MLLRNSWKVGYVNPSASMCVGMTVGRIRTCSKSFSVRLPPKSVRAAQMCGYSAHSAPTCEECEATALLFMCLRLPRLCYFLLSLCSAALAPAPSSHSAALAGVLHLTLPPLPRVTVLPLPLCSRWLAAHPARGTHTRVRVLPAC